MYPQMLQMLYQYGPLIIVSYPDVRVMEMVKRQ